jgi:hypothetical protein
MWPPCADAYLFPCFVVRRCTTLLIVFCLYLYFAPSVFPYYLLLSSFLSVFCFLIYLICCIFLIRLFTYLHRLLSFFIFAVRNLFILYSSFLSVFASTLSYSYISSLTPSFPSNFPSAEHISVKLGCYWRSLFCLTCRPISCPVSKIGGG